jgi:hypothetical protein
MATPFRDTARAGFIVAVPNLAPMAEPFDIDNPTYAR